MVVDGGTGARGHGSFLSRHVVLVGLPGSGKTTVGSALASRLEVAFHDIDSIIEADAGVTIRQIFADSGESGFRSAEARTVSRLLEGAPAVIAPGGGWLAQPGNLEAARTANAFLAYLRCSPTVAARRTAGDSTRPLLATGDPLATIRELLVARESFYLQSDLTVDSDGKEPAEVVEELVGALRREDRGTGAQGHGGTRGAFP